MRPSPVAHPASPVAPMLPSRPLAVSDPAAGARPDVSGSRANEPAPTDAATLGRWRARLDALTRWCLSDVPLAPAAAVVAAGARPTLGDLLRRTLGRAGAGVVDLLDALDAPNDPIPHAQLTRVLGADVLLTVATARGGAVVRAESRACRTAEEALMLVGAFLGGAVAPWMATAGAHVRDAIASPLLAEPLDGSVLASSHAAFARHLSDTAAESTLVLPLLYLDGRAPTVQAPPPVVRGVSSADTPPLTVFGGVLRPGAAFLDGPGLGVGSAVDQADDETLDDEARDDDPDEPDDDDALAPDAPTTLGLAPVPVASPAAADEPEDESDDEPAVVAEHARAALERLRARRGPVERVPVVIASDDGVAEHVGDAAAWLAEASEQELRALARGGWTGDTAVELALAADDPEVDDVARQARRHESELVVEIDGDAAAAWLRRHRPETAERLEAVL